MGRLDEDCAFGRDVVGLNGDWKGERRGLGVSGQGEKGSMSNDFCCKQNMYVALCVSR